MEPDDVRALAVLSVAFGLAVMSLVSGRRGLARAVWAIALVLVTVPFGDLHLHTHWSKVNWIPFVGRWVKLTDVVANVILYLPFGFLAPWRRTLTSTAVQTIALTAVFASLLEWTQLFSHTRFPSATDVVSDVAGAVLGTLVAGRFSVAFEREGLRFG